VHIYDVHLSWFLLAPVNHFQNRIYALYTSIPVATLSSCSLYFVCSLFRLLQCHEIFLRTRTMLWKTLLLLSESIFSVRSNTLVFKFYILLDIQVVVVVKPVFYTTGLSSLSYFLLLFLCRPMAAGLATFICDYGSSGEFPAPQPRCWCFSRPLLQIFFVKTQKTFALHFFQELQIFCGELCFNCRSHMHLWYHGHQGSNYWFMSSGGRCT
jgi:hypothetical protein